MKTYFLTFATIYLSTTTSFATTFENCHYEEMKVAAIEKSLITEKYGESIVHSGGPLTIVPEQALLVADLVSQTGYREIHLIYCDKDGKITDGGSSVRQGKVVFP